MADVTISATSVTLATRTADLVGSGTSVTAGQTFAFAVADSADKYVLVLEEQNSGSATVTFDAGDLPPAHRQGLGSLAITLAQADLRIVVIEMARHLQSDGTVTGSVATNTVKFYVLKLPNT